VGRRLPQLLAILCALAAFVATGCGGDRSNLIPSQRAQDLTAQLDALQQQIQAGECDGLTTKVTMFHDDATALPNSVDKRLRTRINEGVKSLQQHARSTCESVAARNAAAAESDTTPPDTQTTDTTTTETTTTETDTTPTTSTPTDTTPTTGTEPTTGTPPDTGGGTVGPTDAGPGDTESGDGVSGGTGGTGDGSDGGTG
jgi:hypothetical protein